MSKVIHLLHLYPNEMNTYGDRGNLLTLVRRAEWHGLEMVVHYHHVGDNLPPEVHMVLGGGGQDSAQADIQADILRIGNKLHKLVQKNIPMLMVCGTYQLFGNKFITHDQHQITGIGIFDMETTGGDKRLIGNVAVQTTDFGMLYGFENHSGQTRLLGSQQAFGTIKRGNGNNGEDKTEGARTHNAIGTYVHGPLLPNNPALADGLLKLALKSRGVDHDFKQLDDTLSTQTRTAASNRKY